jgi:N6-adenosine-specific RNA methylase IME4
MSTTSTATAATKASVKTTAVNAEIDLDDLEVHPSAELLPEMDDSMYQALVDDINANGQRQHIALFNGQIIDGRARYKACQELGVTPMVQEINLDPSKAPDAIASMNLIRKHWTDGQRAMLAARITTTALGSNQRQKDAVTQTDAAKRFGVSVDSVQRAQQVLKKNHKALVDHVVRGDIPLTAAASAATHLSGPTITTLLKGDKLEEFARKVGFAVNTIKAKEGAANDDDAADAASKKQADEPLVFKLPLGSQKFGLIYANPLAQSDLLSFEQMSTMPVSQLADEDALLFLWTSNSKLVSALKLMKSWDFQYKTTFVWDKQLSGGGTFHNGRHDLLLVGVRGSGASIPQKTRPESLLREKVGGGLRKPIEGYVMLETVYPSLRKIELFCDGIARDGWTSWNYVKPASVSIDHHLMTETTDFGAHTNMQNNALMHAA